MMSKNDLNNMISQSSNRVKYKGSLGYALEAFIKEDSNSKTRKKRVKVGASKDNRVIKKNTKKHENKILENKNSKAKKSELTSDIIMRTLNDENRWEGKIVEVYDDGVDVKIGNKRYFVIKEHFNEGEWGKVKIGAEASFEIVGNEIDKAKKNKNLIKALCRPELKDGVYKGVIAGYDKENKIYKVLLGNVGGKQEEFYLSVHDMKTAGTTKVGDVVSVEINENEKEFRVTQLHISEGSKIKLTSNDYKYIGGGKNKGSISIKLGHYGGFIHKNQLPENFNKGDSLNITVSAIKNEKITNADKQLKGKWLYFDKIDKSDIVKKITKNYVKNKKQYTKTHPSTDEYKEKMNKNKNVA